MANPERTHVPPVTAGLRAREQASAAKNVVECEEDEIRTGHQAQEPAALGENVEVVCLDPGPEVMPVEGLGGDLGLPAAEVLPRVEHLAAEVALGNDVTIDADDHREAHPRRRQGDVGAVAAESDDEEAAVEDLGRERWLEGGDEILRLEVVGHAQVPSPIGESPSRLATSTSATG